MLQHFDCFLKTTNTEYLLEKTVRVGRPQVAAVLVPIASVRRRTLLGDAVVFEEGHSYSRNRNRTELAAQANVYWLRAKVLHPVALHFVIVATAVVLISSNKACSKLK